MEIVYHLTQSPLPWLGLLLQLAAPKPEIRNSIIVDPDPSKSLAETQKTVLGGDLNPFEFFSTVGNK
jgi:hypothetical protein